MATGGVSGKSNLLAGFYNAEKRTQQVLQKLEEELERFRNTDFTSDTGFDPCPPTAGIKKEESLESIRKEIDDLQNEVAAYAFQGKHFTRQYRTFQGTCDKLLQKLDSLNTTNNQDNPNGNTKEGRGEAIKRIQSIVADINSKVHPDGKCCVDCELYGTMWQ